MKLIQLLLIPFTIVYGLVILVRNLLYDVGIFTSTQFDIPTICVGNLSFGGTGKTPHIEYLVRLFNENNIFPAVLSRGYRRKTNGYIWADNETTYDFIGDEPCQIKQKFKDEVAVGVCENRVIGIPNLLYDAPHSQVVLLDDAFQHRAIKAGLNILLTDFSMLYSDDFLPPAGRLREYRNAAKRAQIIVVTKCPLDLSVEKRLEIVQKLKPEPNQKVLFSYQQFGGLQPVFDANMAQPSTQTPVILFSGIANPASLLNHIQANFTLVNSLRFPDHHDYKEADIIKIKTCFNEIKAENGIIITTEKDMIRLQTEEIIKELCNLPIFYLPLKIDFLDDDKAAFNNSVLSYINSAS